MWAVTELQCCRGIKRSFSNKRNYTNMLEPCVLFNSSPRNFPRGTCFCVSQRDIPVPQASSGSTVALCALGGNQYWASDPSEEQLFLQEPGIVCQAGILELAEPLLPCRPHRQLALLPLAPCPAAPWHFCPLRCLCSVEKDPFAIWDLPKEAVRALSASARGRSWVGAGGHNPRRAGTPLEVVLCDVGLFLTKEMTIVRGSGGKT